MPRPALCARLVALLAIVALLGAACRGDDNGESTPVDGQNPSPMSTEAPFPTITAAPPRAAPTATAASPDSGALIEARPYRLVEPEDADEDQPAPLILVLHGYGQGSEFSSYFNLDPVVVEDGALVAYPLGTPDAIGRRFWNATEVCCDFFGRGVDDVAYLSAVIDDVASKHRVDANRIYVVGYSNGAFMAQRLACELDDRIAAIVSVAGVNWLDPTMCSPSEAVAVLHVHGDADPVVQYTGGRMRDGAPLYPSVPESIEGWRNRNRCAGEPQVIESAFDFALNLAGVETSVSRYEDCMPGGAVELWTVHGGDHDIVFGDAFAQAVWAFLQEHPKPQAGAGS